MKPNFRFFHNTNKKQLGLFLATFFIFLAIPITVYLSLNSRPSSPKAAGLAIRDVVGDLWADTIIGKPDFGEIAPNEVVANRLYTFRASGGIAKDSLGHIYIYDPGNSRVLGLSLADCYASSKCTADTSGGIVLGQTNFNTSACNGDGNFQSYPAKTPASAAFLCGLEQDQVSISESIAYGNLAVDSANNVYVVDRGNHRVVKYNTPYSGDKIADEVWGQNDFSGTDCNRSTVQEEFSPPSASVFCFFIGGGITFDPAGNMWVADSGNQRVLRFSKNTDGSIAKTPDLVIGQTVFTTRVKGNGLDQLDHPVALTFKDANTLFVTDTNNFRVLKFTAPFTSGMNGSTFGSGFGTVTGVTVDPTGAGMWVTNTGKGSVELWNNEGISLLKLLGKTSVTIGCGELCNVNGSVVVDASNNVLVNRSEAAWDIFRFSNPLANPNQAIQFPDKQFFTPPISANKIGASGIVSANGVEVAGNQLIVADNSRLLFWNDPNSLSNGKSASGVIVPGGVSDFTTKGPVDLSRIKADKENRLWVVRFLNPTTVWVYQLPLTTGAAPIRTISMPVSVMGGGSLSFSGLVGDIEPADDGSYFWLSNRDTHRVIRVRTPLTTPLVDVILGQTSVSGTTCNRGVYPAAGYGVTTVADLDMLCKPGGLGVDKNGNLFVSDHSLEIEGNHRLLVFNKNTIPVNNSSLILAPAAVKSFPEKGTQQHVTFDPVFDSCNRMYVGFNGYNTRFVGVYNDPLGPAVVPDAYLKDYYSQAYSTAIDANDNLYVGELNRARVLVYKKPNTSCTTSDLPQVSITSPANLATVSGTVTIAANASDNGSISKVEFYLNNNLRGTDTTAPYSYNLDTISASYQGHQISVKAYDNFGNTNSATVNIKITNSCQTSVPNDKFHVCFFDTKDPRTGRTVGQRDEGSFGSPVSPTMTAIDHNYQGNGEYGETDTFSGSWVGNLNFASGTYELKVDHNDGFRIDIGDNGSFEIDRWTSGGNFVSTPVSLSGYTKVRFEWYEDTGDAGVFFRWINKSLVNKVGDVNFDGKVNILDISKLIDKWAATTKPPEDLNQDGTVNIQDISIVIDNWG